jgi:trimeric autotransporter adhesin
MRSLILFCGLFFGALSANTFSQGTPGYWSGDFSMAAGCSWHVLHMDATDDGKVYLRTQGHICGQATGDLFVYDPNTDEFEAVGDFSRTDGGNPSIAAIRAEGNNIYFGGIFSHVDGVEVNGFARLNTSSNTWTAFGQPGAIGMTDGSWVSDILITDDDIYVTGRFEEMGGIASRGIARWDLGTQQWHAMGDGLTSEPHWGRSLARTDDGTIYVAGQFSEVDGNPANNIAAWNGTNWSALGEGTNTTVFTLAADGMMLYAGGQFSQAGGQSIGRLAAWDGSDWSSPASDIQTNILFAPKISALQVSDGFLYAGGFFDSIDSIPAQDLARMDLATGDWTNIEDGAGEGLGRGGTAMVFSRGIESMALVGSKLYVGGNLTRAGGQGVNNIAGFDLLDEQWSVLGSGTGQGISSQDVWGVAHTSQGVLALGAIGQSGLLRANAIARRTIAEDAWSGFANNEMQALMTVVNRAASVGDDVFVGGSFSFLIENPDNPSFVGPTRSIKRWNAAEGAWEGLIDADTETGMSGSVRALADYEGNLLVAGNIASAGGTPVNHLALWNRSTETWSGFGDGLDAAVETMAIGPNGEIYVGGAFGEAGDTASHRVAMWDPAFEAWFPLGAGISNSDESNPAILSMAVTGDGDLVVGGQFDTAGTTSVNSLARWDGENWYDLGGGVIDSVANPGRIQSIAIAQSGEVFIGGRFAQAGVLPVNNMARLHEGQWSRIGPDSEANGISGPPTALVFDLALKGPDLIVGGNFSLAGGEVAANFAHFVRDLGGAEIEISVDVGEVEDNDDPEQVLMRTSSGLLTIIEVRNLGFNTANNVEFSVTADPVPDTVDWTCAPLPNTDAICPQSSGVGLPELVFNLPPQSGLRFELLMSVDSDAGYIQQVSASTTSTPVLDGDQTSTQSSSTTLVNDRLFRDRFQ